MATTTTKVPKAKARLTLLGHGRADTGPVFDEYGRSGAHLWVCRTVVLDKRAAAAAISAESWSFDQLRQVCALWRQPHSDWSGGFSAHSRPCSEGLSYGDNDSCRRAPEFVLKLSAAESWWSGLEDEFFQLGGSTSGWFAIVHLLAFSKKLYRGWLMRPNGPSHRILR